MSIENTVRALQVKVTSPAQGNCLACLSDNSRLLGVKNHYQLRQCSQCGTIFTNSKNEQEALRDLYEHYYDYANFETAPVVAASLEKLIRSFKSFRHTSRLLDVGYGEGGLLRIAQKQGWNCYGTEISPQALEYGQGCGWTVSSEADTHPLFPAQGFDVVTMIELLEHVQNPHQLLRMAAQLLRPGGVLYLTTPNANSLNRRLLGLKWSVISPPEHLTIWTVQGLRLALSQAGFQLQRTRTEGLNPAEILAQWQAPKNETVEVNRNQTGAALNSAFSSNAFRRSIKTGINHCLSTFRLGDSLKIQALRQQSLPTPDETN